MTTNRDHRLDIFRSLTMIHIVCVIHVIYWIKIFDEPWRSLLLFEMPAIFFIAGASQSLKKDCSMSLFKEMSALFVNRVRRVLVPYYAFLAVFYVVMAVCTWCFDCALDYDLRKLSAADIVKTIATGGSDNINFYGHTWFISCYLIVSLLLPVYKRIMTLIGKYHFLVCNILVIIYLSYVEFPIGDIMVKNIPLYSFFYMCGYCFYRGIKRNMFIVVATLSTIVTIVFFLSGIAMPMQDHKFPADYVFLCYGISALSLLSLVFRRISVPHSKLLSLWNTEGYNIYLYQALTYSVAVFLCRPLAAATNSHLVLFAAYSAIIFILSTLLAIIIRGVKTLHQNSPYR